MSLEEPSLEEEGHLGPKARREQRSSLGLHLEVESPNSQQLRHWQFHTTQREVLGLAHGTLPTTSR